MSRTHAWMRLLAWVVVLLAGLAALSAAGRGALGPPPLSSPSGWGSWLGARPPVVAAFALLRVAAMGLAWYSLGATALATVARLARGARLVALADAVSLPSVRRLTTAAIGLTLATAPLAVRAARGGGPVVTVVAQPATGGDAAGPAGGDGTAPVMRRLPDDPAQDPPGQPSGEPRPPSPAAGPRDVPATFTIGRGDHLWRMAAVTLARAWGRPPSDAQIAPYWVRVVEANRHHLADPHNPDLVFPGQVMDVPPPPPPPTA